MKSLRPLVILIILVDLALVGLAYALLTEEKVGQLLCHTDMECEMLHGPEN